MDKDAPHPAPTAPPAAGRWSLGVGGILVLLVVAALLPMLGTALLRASERAAAGRAAAQSRALDRSYGVALALDARVRHVRAVVAAAAHAVGTRRADSLRNDSLLRAIWEEAGADHIAHLWIADPTGRPFGTSRRPRPASSLFRLDDRLYFREALRTRRPAVGEPVRTRTDSTVWSLAFAHPVLDDTGGVAAVVIGTIALSSLSPTLAASDLPPGSLITLIDAHGRVIGRSMEHEEWIGRDVSDFPSVREHMERGTGVAEIVGLDGGTRLAAFTRTTEVPWHVFVGLPPATAYAESTAALRRDLLLTAVALALALGAALLIAARLTRPLRLLEEDALALAHGDVSRRSRSDGVRELATLGRAFDVMAATVAARTAQLHESERRYRQLFDSSPLPLLAVDSTTFRLLAVNDAALAQYGYSREQFLRLTLLDLRPPEDRVRFLMAAHADQEAGRRGVTPVAGVWRHRRANGEEIEVQAFTVVTEYDGRPAWITTPLDVTARRRTERALAESQEQLRQAQKMEALGRFAGAIAHDFNNLLTGVLGYGDLALESLAADAPARADVEEIRATARRAADLTRQILAFSRRQMMQPERLDLNTQIRELTGLCERVAGDHVQLVLDLDPTLGAVLADRTQLEQVLVNLVTNARDAMPDGGTLTIRTRNASAADHPADDALPPGDWVQVSVSDTGVGMDDEVMSQIFEPFFTTKPRGKGTGLGLATVDGIVQQSGGVLRVRSAPGRGSTFTVALPDSGPATTPSPTPTIPRAEGSRPSTGDETVLLVEDDEAVRALARSVLARQGYAVLVACDAAEALAIAATHEGTIHLLLTDVVMPGLNGRELAERLVVSRPGMRVLLMSGFTEDDLLHRSGSELGLGFLAKPFTPEVLGRRVRGLLDLSPDGRTTPSGARPARNQDAERD